MDLFKDKKIDALENVINSAMNYVKQFVSLDEDEIVEYHDKGHNKA